MPFRLQGRATDEDSWPNAVLTTTWDVTASPSGANYAFSDGTSLTPMFIGDTPGSYTLTMTAFDGVVTSSASTTFSLEPTFFLGVYQSGTCSGAVPNSAFVFAEASSSVSLSDVTNLATTAASSALSAVLNCCNASYRLVLPSDAPSGATIAVFTEGPFLPSRQELNFASGAGLTVTASLLTDLTVGSNVAAGQTVDLATFLPPSQILSNTPFKLGVSLAEQEVARGLDEVADFSLTIAPLDVGGDISTNAVTKMQRLAPIYPPSYDRSLGYTVLIPNPLTARFSLTIGNRVPPYPTYGVNFNGWDYLSRAAAHTVDSIGLFILTGGILAAPTSEALIHAFTPESTLSTAFDFPGFSQTPYRGSLYSSVYTDRNAYAATLYSGSISGSGSLTPWTTYLAAYAAANNLTGAISVYFRAGKNNSGVYTWYANSIPLYLESNAAGVSLGSLIAGSGILAATNSVITFAAGLPASGFYATVSGVPAVFTDLYRFNTLSPAGATLGVYLQNAGATAYTRAGGITPTSSGARGYSVIDLKSFPTIATALSGSGAAIAFYIEDGTGHPIANSFPLSVTNLTLNIPTNPPFTISNAPALGAVPAGSNSLLTILDTQNPKLFIANSSS